MQPKKNIFPISNNKAKAWAWALKIIYMHAYAAL